MQNWENDDGDDDDKNKNSVTLAKSLIYRPSLEFT